MKKLIFILALYVFLLFSLFQISIAHETLIYKIGDKSYQFIVGSSNEPVVVDEMTAIDFRAYIVDETNRPIKGLEDTVEVEISSDDKEKVMPLLALKENPGNYKAYFIPTLETALTYRFFGTVEDIKIDMSFTCSPIDSWDIGEDNGVEILPNNVMRIYKVGTFSCPISREKLGFPDPTTLTYAIVEKVETFENILSKASTDVKASNRLSLTALIIGILALITAVVAVWTMKKYQYS